MIIPSADQLSSSDMWLIIIILGKYVVNYKRAFAIDSNALEEMAKQYERNCT